MTEYAPELVSDLFEHIAEGRSAKSFCRERHISFSRLLEWINDDPERRDRYHLARLMSADALADEIVELADSATPENYNAVRVQVDARKWVAAKLRPQSYGDKVDVTTRDGDVGLSSAQIAAKLASLLERMGVSPEGIAILTGRTIDGEAEEVERPPAGRRLRLGAR